MEFSAPFFHSPVHTSKVQENAARQYSVFDLEKSDKPEKLDKVVDQLREKYGEDAIFRASFLKSNVSHMSGGLDKERRSGVTLGMTKKLWPLTI